MSLFDLPENDPAVSASGRRPPGGPCPTRLLLTGSGSPGTPPRFAAAAMECPAEGTRPAGLCPACRKVWPTSTRM